MSVKASERQGFALISTLAIVIVVGLMVAGGVLLTQIELSISRNDATALQARYVAQAGLEKYRTQLFQFVRWLDGTDPSETATTVLQCGDVFGGAIDLSRGTGTPIPFVNGVAQLATGELVLDATGAELGRYDVRLIRDPANPLRFVIESRGASVTNARASVRATVQIEVPRVFEQAIFAGTGQANRFINGATTVRGGIYVVGDSSDPGALVIDGSGSFDLLNDYNLIGRDLTGNNARQQYGNFDPLLRVAEDARAREQLCASLRVQYGQVRVTNSVSLGTSGSRLLGAFVGQNRGDLFSRQGEIDAETRCGQRNGVCADAVGTFDISNANAPSFPTLEGPATAGTCPVVNGERVSWRECIRSEAVTEGLQVDLVSGVPTFAPASATEAEGFAELCTDQLSNSPLVLDATPIDCTFESDGETFGFSYDPSTTPASLRVYGTLSLAGYDVVMQRDVQYFATSPLGDGLERNVGSLFVDRLGTSGGNVDINGRFVTGVDTSLPVEEQVQQQYPNHVLGLVAAGDVYQRGSAVMAPIYAGGSFRIVQQNVLLGSVVADEFCTTSAGNQTSCEAGQASEVIYVSTGNRKPPILQLREETALLFRTVSSEFF